MAFNSLLHSCAVILIYESYYGDVFRHPFFRQGIAESLLNLLSFNNGNVGAPVSIDCITKHVIVRVLEVNTSAGLSLNFY